MKNTFLILAIFVSSLSFAQKNHGPNPTNLEANSLPIEFCITFNCCGIGPFGVEIWSDEACMEIEISRGVSRNKLTLGLKSSKKINNTEIILTEDIILPGNATYENKKMYIPKGTYKIENNSIVVYPKPTQTREVCVTQSHNGSFFGNDYEFEIEICFSLFDVDVNVRSNKGLVTLTPKLTTSQKTQLKNSTQKTITFKKSFTVEKDGYSCFFEAGDYTLNDDGNIYIPNVKLK